MGDAVSSAAGAERPDIFSEMTVPVASNQCGEGGRLGSTLQYTTNPKIIINSCLQLEVASRSGQMAAVVNSAQHKLARWLSGTRDSY